MLQQLETLRDEFKLQAHLFKEEMGQKIEQLNDQWGGIRSSGRVAQKDVRKATQVWVKAMRKSYQRVKDSFNRRDLK